jgi:hypothetical protein
MSVPNRFAKRLRLERKRPRKQEARLGHRRDERPFPGKPHFDLPAGAKIVSSEAVGAVKMSEILPEFVEPFLYLEADTGREGYLRLLRLGATAWNIALFPPAKRRPAMERAIEKTLGNESGETKDAVIEVIEALVERKVKYFAQYGRPILDLSLEDTGNGYYLQVVSSMG